jgi:uncharacterized protein (TIGR00369 family)
MNTDLTRTIDEQGNHCFGCGPENPQGLHLHFTLTSEDPTNITATATVNLTRTHEGPPGYIHGGIIATLMDEAMSKLSRPLGLLAMTRNLQVDYLRPCPLHIPLTLTARHLRREGRKLFQAAELHHPDGTLLASATGLFLAIDPSLIPGRKADQDLT